MNSVKHPITALLLVHQDDATFSRALESLAWTDRLVVLNRGRPGDLVWSGGEVLDVGEAWRDAVGSLTGDGWYLLVKGHEYLAPDAPEQFATWRESVPDDITAVSLPLRTKLHGRTVRGHAAWPEQRVRLVKKRAFERLDDPAESACPEAVGFIHAAPENGLAGYAEKLRLDNDWARAPALAEALRQIHDLMRTGDDPNQDDDLVHAVRLVVAWNLMVDALTAWEQGGCSDALEQAFMLPVSTVKREELPPKVLRDMQAELQAFHDDNQRLSAELTRLGDELLAIRRTPIWKGYEALKKLFPWLLRRDRS